jgi:DHA1 family bicyclomycin/chloramphenicol resistance-like MFS transporter
MDELGMSTAGTGDQPPPFLILFFGALVALGPLSMDAYLPAIPAMAEAFGVSIVSINNTLSVFLIGYAAGQFFGGSVSDQIGRKRVGTVGLTIYVFATIAIAFAHNVEQMLALRFLQAIGGGFSTVICMATVRDIYPLHELGKRFATVTMVVLVAPLVAPVLGSLLLPLGWESIFLVKAVYAVVLFALYALLVPETRPGTWNDLSFRAIFRQCGDVVTRRVNGLRLPVRYALAMAFSGGMLMTFVTNASFIYMEYFGIGAGRFPFVFGLSVLGFMTMNLFSMRRLHSDNAAAFFRRGLLIQLSAVALLVVVTASGFDTLWTVVPLIVVMMSTLGIVGPAGSARYMGFFDKLAGSASSVYTTMMFAFGGVLGIVTGVLYDGSLLPVVAVMAAASLVASAIGLSLPVAGAGAGAGGSGRHAAAGAPSARSAAPADRRKHDD